jgi:hypothetical protein
MSDDIAKTTAGEAAECFVKYVLSRCGAGASVHDLEAALVPVVREAGRMALQISTQQRIDEGVAEGKRSGRRVHRRVEVPFIGVFGTFSVVSPYLWNRGAGVEEDGCARPAELVGVRARGRTRGVQRALADFGAEESFGAAAKRFKEHYGFDVERRASCLVKHSRSASALSRSGLSLEQLVSTALAQRPGVAELLLEVDGCEIRTGRQALQTEERQRYVSARAGVRSGATCAWFGASLTSSSRRMWLSRFARYSRQRPLRRGHRGLSSDTKVIACADGKRDTLGDHFTDVQHILDRPHL